MERFFSWKRDENMRKMENFGFNFLICTANYTPYFINLKIQNDYNR